MRRARGPVVWLLVLALAVYGCSSVLVQLLGPAHRHTTSLSASPSWLHQAGEALRQVRAWRAELHARWLPPGHDGLHGTAHPHAHPHPHPHPQPSVAGDAAFASADEASLAHAHAHATFQRHHHDPHDATVIALDGADAGVGADGVSSAAAGSATLPLGLAAPWALPAATARPARWQRPASDRWTDAAVFPLEQPPRA